MSFRFVEDDIQLDYSIVNRLEFREKRCNLTLKNPSEKKQPVDIKIWVLNGALIEIWSQLERWTLTSLQPGQMHACSWDFKPSVPDTVWNEKARLLEPYWVIIHVGHGILATGF